jgi:hypothetical protein
VFTLFLKKSNVIVSDSQTMTLHRYFRLMNPLENVNDRHTDELAAKVSRLKNVSEYLLKV